VIEMMMRMLMWFLIMAPRVLMKKVRLDEGAKQERHPKMYDGVSGILSFMMWHLEVSVFLHHHSKIKPCISTSSSFLMTI